MMAPVLKAMTDLKQSVPFQSLSLLTIKGFHSRIKDAIFNTSLVSRITCKCADFSSTRIRRFTGPSQTRSLCSGVDGEPEPIMCTKRGDSMKENGDIDGEETSNMRIPRNGRLSGQRWQGENFNRVSGWPWISVIPSEATGNIGRVERNRNVWNDPSSPNDGSYFLPHDFPLVHRDPGVRNLLKALPASVPENICSLLRKYGWSAHTLLELRTLMAMGTKLKARQVYDVLAKQKDAHVAYNFLEWSLGEANCRLHIKCFNVVLLLLGRVRKYDMLEKLLEDLDKRGYSMDKIIFTTAMRCYAEGQRMQEALELFVQMQKRGFKPDCVTYSVLMQMFSKAKLYQDALKLYEDMLAQGVATDTQLYNCVVSIFGKAGRLDLAYEKLEEMRERGHIPDQFTYGVLLEGYAKAGRREFMDLYREMQSAGTPVNEVIFNIMFAGIERIGTLHDAECLFADMEGVGVSANLNAFSTLIGMCSKKGDAEGARRWFDKMTSIGLKPTLAVGNSLLNSYARARQFGQAKQILDSFQDWGLTPDLPTLTVCMRCLSLCERLEDLKIVQRMLSCHSGSQFLSVLLDNSAEKNLAPVIASFLGGIHFERRQNRRDFINVLIDYLYKIGFRRKAYLVWEGALASYVFPGLVDQGAEGICSVNIRGMECGTAIIALTFTLPQLAKQFHRKEMMPEWVQIYTLHLVEESLISSPTSVHKSVETLLKDLHSPFHAGTLQTGGGFVCRGEEVMHWLDEPDIRAMLAFKH